MLVNLRHKTDNKTEHFATRLFPIFPNVSQIPG